MKKRNAKIGFCLSCAKTPETLAGAAESAEVRRGSAKLPAAARAAKSGSELGFWGEVERRGGFRVLLGFWRWGRRVRIPRVRISILWDYEHDSIGTI